MRVLFRISRFKNQWLLVPLVLMILLMILSMGFLIQHTLPQEQISFLGEFSLAEQLEIKKDLSSTFAKELVGGLQIRIKKSTFPNCDPLQRECTQYLVEYVYNEYGDWVPGYLYKEDGVFKYKPSI